MQMPITGLAALFCATSLLAQMPADPLPGSESAQAAPASPSPAVQAPRPLAPALAPSAAPVQQVGPEEKLTSFDSRFAELLWKNDHWEMVSLGQVVKRFDNRRTCFETGCIPAGG